MSIIECHCNPADSSVYLHTKFIIMQLQIQNKLIKEQEKEAN